MTDRLRIAAAGCFLLSIVLLLAPASTLHAQDLSWDDEPHVITMRGRLFKQGLTSGMLGVGGEDWLDVIHFKLEEETDIAITVQILTGNIRPRFHLESLESYDDTKRGFEFAEQIVFGDFTEWYQLDRLRENNRPIILASLPSGDYFITLAKNSRSTGGMYLVSVVEIADYSLGGYRIEALSCRGDDAWFILHLLPSELSDELTLFLDIVTEGNASIGHFLPLPNKNLGDYGREILTEVGIFAVKATLEEIPLASLILGGAETLFNVDQLIQEARESADRQGRQIRMLRFGVSDRERDSSWVLHIRRNGGSVSTEARYFLGNRNSGFLIPDVTEERICG